MKSVVIKRSVIVAGHKTSISLEDPFWNSLKEIAGLKRLRLPALLTLIDTERYEGNLSSAIRLFVLKYYRDQQEIRDGHDVAQGLGIRPHRISPRFELARGQCGRERGSSASDYRA